ncbi:MAG: hypothetical protein RIS38_1011 [Verrucomicrobiota bacterium]|jgi:hypothetical protein
MKSLLLALLATGSLFAGEKTTLTLADFTDLNGGAPGAGWKTEEGGVIHLSAQKGTGALISKKEYASFELTWEWRLEAAGNNGIKYWVANLKDAKGRNDWLGVEYQMIDDDKHPDGIKGGSHNTGSIYDIIDSFKDKAKKPIGEWNQSRVVVKDGKIEHFLNGKPSCAADTRSAEWQAALAKSKFKTKKGFAPGQGKLMLTEHGDPCWFRNLVITEL